MKTAEVLKLYYGGMGHKTIAAKLGISARIARVILIDNRAYQPGKLKRLSGGPCSRKQVAEKKAAYKMKRLLMHIRKGKERVRKCLNKWPKMTEAERFKYRYENELPFRITHVLRSRVRKVVKRGNRYSEHTLDWLGISPVLFIKWIEVLWERGMTWDNYGCAIRQWSIDHIRPCASFDLMKASERAKCFHYTNMQPMWHLENIIKGDKW